MLTPVIGTETERLKHGDVFTISSDSAGLRVPKEWNEGRLYILVPEGYQSRSLRKIWELKIKNAEKRNTQK